MDHRQSLAHRILANTQGADSRTGLESRKDGRPVTELAFKRALSTQAILDEDLQVISWALAASKGGITQAVARDGPINRHLTPTRTQRRPSA